MKARAYRFGRQVIRRAARGRLILRAPIQCGPILRTRVLRQLVSAHRRRVPVPIAHGAAGTLHLKGLDLARPELTGVLLPAGESTVAGAAGAEQKQSR